MLILTDESSGGQTVVKSGPTVAGVHCSVASAVMKQVESGKVRGGSCNLGGRLLYYPHCLAMRALLVHTPTFEIMAEGQK